MKKMLKTLGCYLCVLCLCTAAINGWYIAREKSDSDWTGKFKCVPQNIQLCNFGSSHGLYGFNYEDFEEEAACFNFSLAAQSLSYDARILENYQDRLAEGSIVLITISYFSFFGVEETQEKDFASKNKKYYDFLPPKQIKAYDFATHMVERYLPSLAEYERLPVVLLQGRANENLQIWSSTAEDVDLLADAASACRRHLTEEKLDEKGNRMVNQEEIQALYRMIELCEEVKAVPVLITTPYMAEYLHEVLKNGGDFYEEFYAVVRQVQEDTGVRYFDYAFDERFIHDKGLFMNADHLNREGARQFTDMIRGEVIGPIIAKRKKGAA